jgi:hypothetical protein
MDVNIAGAIANMLLDLEHAVKQINSDSLWRRLAPRT